MCPEITKSEESVAITPAPAAVKAKPKKAPAKKAAPKVKKTVAKAKKESTPRGPSIRLQVFKLLAKATDGLSGGAIKEKLELGGVPSLLKDEGCAANPRIKRHVNAEGRGVLYLLTAAGKKALEKDTVDSVAPKKAAGSDWPEGR